MEFRKLVFKYHTGFAGCDGIDFFEVSTCATEKELDDFAWEQALEHAETYGTEPYPDDITDEELENAECSAYSDNIEGWYEVYNPEEHDDQVPGGGKPSWSRVEL